MSAPVAAAVNRAHSASEQANREADADADKAMDWLKKAISAGFADVRHMKQDQDLEALRDRQDFRQLAADLEARQENKKN